MDKSAEGGLKSVGNTMPVRNNPFEHREQLHKILPEYRALLRGEGSEGMRGERLFFSFARLLFLRSPLEKSETQVTQNPLNLKLLYAIGSWAI